MQTVAANAGREVGSGGANGMGGLLGQGEALGRRWLGKKDRR